MTKYEDLIKDMQDVTELKYHVAISHNLRNKSLCIVYHVLLKSHYQKRQDLKEYRVIIEKVQRRIQII